LTQHRADLVTFGALAAVAGRIWVHGPRADVAILNLGCAQAKAALPGDAESPAA